MEAIIFVYNADRGLFNSLADMAHKIFSPRTYSCNLCAITHSGFGMREEWKKFINSLQQPLEFLHRNELAVKYGISDIPLPVILVRTGKELEILISADEINQCRTMAELQELIEIRLAEEHRPND